jgi:hypothetical protein
MLRSCILNLCVKGCARSLPDNISIEVVLKKLLAITFL